MKGRRLWKGNEVILKVSGQGGTFYENTFSKGEDSILRYGK